MSEMSPLRRRMIEDMTIRNLSPATQRSYLHAVTKFSRYFGQSPDRLGLEDVRAFQVHLVSSGLSWPALNQTVCALRFFFGVSRSGMQRYRCSVAQTFVCATDSGGCVWILGRSRRVGFAWVRGQTLVDERQQVVGGG
ncbi:site-specific integrase (plasmid) [Sinorhizobium meliloti]|nr:site-specific integrase [Sinorhizobium meliloti]